MNRLIIGIFVIACAAPLFAQQNQVPVINNTVPRNGNAPYAEIKLLQTIPTYDDAGKYGINMVYDFAVDNNANLYVVSRDENNITVFDRDGKYVRTVGRKGQGPGEFQSPYNIAIKDNEMHVFQRSGSLVQVLDLQGKYIRKITVPGGGNYDFIYFYGEYYLTSNIKFNIFNISEGNRRALVGGNPEFYVSVEMRDKNFKMIRDIVSVQQKDIKDDRLSTQHSNILSGSNIDKYIYFPQNTDKYEITKYDLDGNALLTFTRKYKQIPFSKPVRDYKERLKEWWIDYYDKQGAPQNMRSPYLTDPSERPWVIRKILIDEKQNVWILAGEWSADADFEVTVEATLDIFGPDGTYLASQKTSAVTYRTVIKNGRLYSLFRISSPIAKDISEGIKVYEIKYKER